MKTRKNRKSSDLVPTFLNMLNTVKLYHWKTTSYSTHKATDKLYSDLNDAVDKFIETYLGTHERSGVIYPLSLKISIYNDNSDFKKQIEKYKPFLTQMSSSKYGPDLLNIRDEILGILNQFLYLLSLH
jgi:DNA-binding ferritin-like protein